MTNASLPSAVLRAASFLAPGDQRAEWLAYWRSELFYIPKSEALLFCLGAFRDAFWLRRNNLNETRRPHLESPMCGLVFIAGIAALSVLLAGLLPLPELMTRTARPAISQLALGCVSMLMTISSLLLPATILTLGWIPVPRHPTPRSCKLRWWIYLCLKILLVQPILVLGFVIMMAIQPLAPIVGQVVMWPILVWPFRWLLLDQKRRCPICLHRLTEPIRIGVPSSTFLDWYGAESTCPRGHGLLHNPGYSASYSSAGRWLNLDKSWSGL